MTFGARVLPKEWKHSVDYPIPKPSKKPNGINNIRPISLTWTLCKLRECMMLTQLVYHLEEANPDYFDPMWTGFRPGMCTQDSLLLLRHLVGGDQSKRSATGGPRDLGHCGAKEGLRHSDASSSNDGSGGGRCRNSNRLSASATTVPQTLTTY